MMGEFLDKLLNTPQKNTLSEPSSKQKNSFPFLSLRLRKTFFYLSLASALTFSDVATHSTSTSSQTSSLLASYDSLEQVVLRQAKELSILRSSLKKDTSFRQQKKYVFSANNFQEKPPLALDTLALNIPLRDYVLEVDKPHQRFRVWKRANYALIADIPCTTGKNKGEKERMDDKKTPSAYFTIASLQNSSSWLYNGHPAYGPYFARLNFGSWNASGVYNPLGHCSIGIHGTNKPQLLGLEDSGGCIRIPNNFLEALVKKGVIASGVQGFIVPYDASSTFLTSSGIGRDRLHNFSEKNTNSFLKNKEYDVVDYDSRIISKENR